MKLRGIIKILSRTGWNCRRILVGNREYAQKLLIKGQQAAQDKSAPTNQDHAYQLLASASYADPTYSTAFYVNGCTASDLLRPHAAVALFRRALEAYQLDTSTGLVNWDEKAKCYTNLAWELMKIGGHREAVRHLHDALRINPKLALPYMHLSMCHQTFGETDVAVGYARKCFELADKNDTAGMAIAEFQLAFALLFARQYAAGLKANANWNSAIAM